MGLLSIFRASAEDDDQPDSEVATNLLAEHKRRLRLLQDGELEADDINGVSETHWRARRPRWTKEPPTKAGLYFIRRGPGSPTRVADVYENRGMWFYEWSDVPPRPITGAGLEFSDVPITEPLP